MTRAERIKTQLETHFQPTQCEVIDESDAHHGHAGWREGGGTHIAVTISAAGLAGLSRVAAHRAIYDALGQELADGLHALRITIV
ncbi:MAG: BolA family transcriptional regulator [Alphaproteobacteria bacterium]|nr:BolA family transcriptional regulator [Alphaproteobacteria bacterium]